MIALHNGVALRENDQPRIPGRQIPQGAHDVLGWYDGDGGLGHQVDLNLARTPQLKNATAGESRSRRVKRENGKSISILASPPCLCVSATLQSHFPLHPTIARSNSASKSDIVPPHANWNQSARPRRSNPFSSSRLSPSPLPQRSLHLTATSSSQSTPSKLANSSTPSPISPNLFSTNLLLRLDPRKPKAPRPRSPYHQNHAELQRLHVSLNRRQNQPRPRNHYNAVSIDVEEPGDNARKFTIEARAYDDAIAFRYVIPEQPNLKEFRLAARAYRIQLLAKDATCYALRAPQLSLHVRIRIPQAPHQAPLWPTKAASPAPCSSAAPSPDGSPRQRPWLAITEADLENKRRHVPHQPRRFLARPHTRIPHRPIPK